MKCCPYCKGREGYLMITTVSGQCYFREVWETTYDHHGVESNTHDNGSMYDSLHHKDHKYARCLDCGKKIKLEDIQKEK